MSYQVLARKWRPSTFEEVVGQPHVVQALAHALDTNRIPHAYLFTGTRGVGKTSLARIIAKCLNCEKKLSAHPCGECDACKAISQGQSFDVLEIDAASRTRVEDTRELLDNVPYKPAHARYKIYIIDEVHMLSNHSFNALLKTLEEPPPHIIFILATTDPERLPMTILSRCLQFHLKPLSEKLIKNQFEKILQQENISYEIDALKSLAIAANGSLRDGLSLLDQAIAHGSGKVQTKSVSEMLGITPDHILLDLLRAIEQKNGEKLFELVQQLANDGGDFSRMLSDLSSLLHEIALIQIVPKIPLEENKKAQLQIFAQQISPDMIQLYYQIAIIGQRDLVYAPSLRQGFEMTLLRMLAFDLPDAPISENKSQPTVISTNKTQTTPQIAKADANNWEQLITQLNLSGMVLQLARHCALKTFEQNHYQLKLDIKQAPFLTDKSRERLQQALTDFHQKPISLTIEIAKDLTDTPQALQENQIASQKAQAHSDLMSDSKLQSVLQTFNTQLNPKHIETKN